MTNKKEWAESRVNLKQEHTHDEDGHPHRDFPWAWPGGLELLHDSRPGWSSLRQAVDFLLCLGSLSLFLKKLSEQF